VSLSPAAFNTSKSGQVRGTSRRNSGSSELGDSASWFNGTNTVSIGMTGSEHSRNDGFKSSNLHEINQTEKV
jgi:hypothetical protein